METPHYREHPPGPALASRVRCFWTIRSPARLAAPRMSRVLPDGCMDVIFDLSDPPLPRPGGGAPLRSYVVGAMRRPLRVPMAGGIDLLGVRFRPGGAAAFVRAPAGELTDGVLALDELWRRAATDLESRLAEAAEARRVPLLRGELERRAASLPEGGDVVSRASELIERSAGAIPVAGLERALGVSRRHLERLFAERVGLTPKTACRVARFQHALARMRRDPATGWSRLALESGYYDQAHLIRDFRALSGLTPGAFRAEEDAVASVQYAGEAAA